MAANEPPIVREIKQVFETIGMAGTRYKLRDQEKEDLVLACFLKHTVFWGRPEAITADRLNHYARRFATDGRLVERGWMLEREFWKSRPGQPSWKLSVAP